MTHIVKIRNMMRLIAASSAAVVAMGAGNAFAQISVDGTNSETGAESENANTWDVNHDFDVDFENTADLWNEIFAEVNTGENNTNRNTTVDGPVATGDVVGDISFENEANEGDGQVGFGGGLGDVDADFVNDTTGYRSENTNELNVNNAVEVNETNEANINNTAEIWANTGKNNTNENTTVDGVVETGDITIIIDAANTANTGGGYYDLDALSGNVDASATNDTTGAYSSNTNEVNVENDVAIDKTNEANINNVFGINANTGGNDTNRNTTVGGTSTGQAAFRIDVANTANTN